MSFRNYKLADGRTVAVSDKKFPAFIRKHPDATAVDGETSARDAYTGYMEFEKKKKVAEEVSDKLSQEEDTALERALGKNVVTDFFGDIYRAGKQGYLQGSTVDEAFDVFAKGKDISEQDLKDFVEVQKELQKYGPSDEMREYERIKEEAGGGVWGFMKGMVQTRGQVIPQVIVSSMASLATTLFDSDEARKAAGATAAAGAVAGTAIPIPGIGTISGGIAGAFAGATGSLETAMTMTELLQDKLNEQGLEFNEENIRNLLENEDEFGQIKTKALNRGLAIGAVEGLTYGLSRGVGSKLISKGASTGKLAKVTTGIEVTGGMGGEFAGQLAAGQEIDTAEILMEGIAEAKGVVNVADLIKKPKYTVNGEVRKNGRKEILKLLDDVESGKLEARDIANIKMEATNDQNLEARIKKVLGDAELETQIDARVETEDRKKLVDLERQKEQAEADVNKKGIFQKPGAKKKLESIEVQINEIIGKYEAAETDAVVEGRQKLAEDVRSIKLDATKQFAKVSSEKLGFDPFSSFKSNNDFVSSYVERSMAGLDISNMTEEQINAQANEFANDANNSDATIIDTPDGNKAIMINEEIAYKYGALEAGSHEVLHGVLKGSFAKMDDATKAPIIGDFKAAIQKDLGANVVTQIENRLKTAYGMTDEQIGVSEEYFTALSDIINDKNNPITFEKNKGFFGGIKDKVASVFNKNTPYKQLSVSTGQDAYNFIKEYSKNVKEGKLSEAMVAFAEGKPQPVTQPTAQPTAKPTAKPVEVYETTDADDTPVTVEVKTETDGARNFVAKTKGKPDKTFGLTKESKRKTKDFIKTALGAKEAVTLKTKPAAKPSKFSKTASDKVQNIYEEQGIAGAMEIIDQFKPITSKIAEKRRNAPNYDKELLMSEIELGPRGILDLIREYNPDSGVPLAAYINKFLPARAIEASKRVLGEEFTQDVTEAKTVAAEEVAETEVTTKPKPKKIVLAERLGIKDKVSKAIEKIVPSLEISKLNFKNLKNQIPEITGELFGISPKKIVSGANITKGELQSSQMFINKNADILINMLPEGATASGTATGVPNTLLKAFYTKTDRAKMTKTGSAAGLAIQQKNKINRSEFLETFGIIDGKPTRTDRNTSARVLALANLTGKMITNQAVRIQIAQETTTATETINNIKDGKSETMFSKSFGQYKLGDLSKPLGVKTVPLISIQKEGKDKVYTSQRDMDAPYTINNKPTGETYQETYSRILNNFLEVNPQFRNLFRRTTTGGITGGIFLTTPEFNKVINAANVEQKTAFKQAYNKSKKLLNSFVTLSKQEGFVKAENKKLPLLKDVFLAIQEHLKQNPADIGFFEDVLKDTGKQQDTFTRVLAPIKGYPVDKNGNAITNKEVVEEHTNPQNEIGKALLAAAQIGEVNKMWKGIGKSYMQLSLLKTDDKKINNAGYQTSMPEVYYKKILPRLLSGELNLPDGLPSVVRLAESGINLNNYYLINEKQTIAEFFGVDGVKNIKKANELVTKQLTGEVTANFSKSISKVNFKENTDSFKTLDKAVLFSRSTQNETKGITVLDFDDTLATTESLVKYTTPDGKTGTLNAEQFASTYENLQDEGYTFDFSDFNKVVKGKLAPLFNKAIKLQGKFGPENMFVLTARPPAAQKAIFDFLKANGLNIPLKNITGLGNSTSEAKALWVADKVAMGYNDFYFADDALQNVQAVKNMLDQFDVKSKVQQARVNFSKTMSKEFNNILQDVVGVESEQVFSKAQAKLRGKKTKYQSIIPPSAQDFMGLLYNFVGKGTKGEKQIAFLKKALVDPFAKGIKDLNSAKQNTASQYEILLKQFPKVKKKLKKKVMQFYTNDHAVRVYLFNKAGFEIPGMSQKDVNALDSIVKGDPELQAFAETLGAISKKDEGYYAPGEHWIAESITSDVLSDGSLGDARSVYLTEFLENKNQIFSEQNLNKIEAVYGSKFREALTDILYRMESGRSRPAGGGRLMNTYMNWTNNSVGAIMFFNMRSAVLQTISAINYINWSDNNPLKAAAAFANQKQYWKDFSMIFNSDFLKQRRAGNQRGINEAELSAAVAGSSNKAKAALAWLLRKGFLPTQIADSFAIASGGATFYRNRVKALMKQTNPNTDEKYTAKEAEEKAFLDFQETTEEAQQSARPDMLSQQQASPLGRLILSFQNTPMQYARIMNKAARDIVNGRGDLKTNVSKILYYGAVQGIIFGALQQAIFASLGEDEEEDFDRKKERILNQMTDSVLSGIGFGGKAISTLKNTTMEFLKQKDKGYTADHAYTILQALSFSPPISSKLRKIYSAIQTDKYNEGVFTERGFTLDNPIWNVIGNVIEGTTNIPLGRLSNKLLNIDNALDSSNETYKRIALLLGWNTWDLGIRDKDIEGIKKKVKKQNKEEKKQKEKENNKQKIEENKKKDDGRCAAISGSGERCKNDAVSGDFCSIHEEVKKRKDGKEVQCKKVKNDGKRCKMKTSNQSGLCYYHD